MSIKSLWTSGKADRLLLEQCKDRLQCRTRSAIHAFFVIWFSLSLSLSLWFFLSFSFGGQERRSLDWTWLKNRTNPLIWASCQFLWVYQNLSVVSLCGRLDKVFSTAQLAPSVGAKHVPKLSSGIAGMFLCGFLVGCCTDHLSKVLHLHLTSWATRPVV